jgi:hypothetical protein
MKHLTFINKLFTVLKPYTDPEAFVVLHPGGLVMKGRISADVVAFFDTGLKNSYKISLTHFRALPKGDFEEIDGGISLSSVALDVEKVSNPKLVLPDKEQFPIDVPKLKVCLKVVKTLTHHTKQLLQRNLLIKDGFGWFYSHSVLSQMPSPFQQAEKLVIPPYVLALLNSLLTVDVLSYWTYDDQFVICSKKDDLDLFVVMKRQTDVHKFIQETSTHIEEPLLITTPEIRAHLKTLNELSHVSDTLVLVFCPDKVSVVGYTIAGEVLDTRIYPTLRENKNSIALRTSVSLVESLLSLGLTGLNFKGNQISFMSEDKGLWAIIPASVYRVG